MLRRFACPVLFSLAAMLLFCLAGPAAQAVDLDAAKADLEQLKKSLKPRATNEDLLQYLDAVFTAYKDLDKPPAPADDASEDEKKAHASAMAKFEKEQDKYRGDVEKIFLKILTLYKVKNETNIRDDVNIRAGKLLGEMAPMLDEKASKDLSKKIMKAIEKKMTKVKTHQVNTEHLEAAFEALAKLNDDGALMWMNANYSHANENQKEYLIAAHKAMVMFKDVKGKYRYEIVSQFVKMYTGIELQAEQTSNDPKIQQKKRFWDEIKTYTIPVVQYFAGQPKDAEGQALAEMKQFQDWLRENKNAKKGPWADPEPAK
jgi:protein required for attachment to host cells